MGRTPLGIHRIVDDSVNGGFCDVVKEFVKSGVGRVGDGVFVSNDWSVSVCKYVNTDFTLFFLPFLRWFNWCKLWSNFLYSSVLR